MKLKNTLLVSMEEGEDDNNDDQSVNQEQMQSQNHENLRFENEILTERENRVKKLEVDVIDANQIMKELSSLVLGSYISQNIFKNLTIFP